jgi:hypothetical protein
VLALLTRADKAAVDTYNDCGNRHPGRPFWKEGDKKREQHGLALIQATESILTTRKFNNKPSTLEMKALESVVVVNKESRTISVSLLMSHQPLFLSGHMCIIKDIILPKTSVIGSDWKVSHVTLFSINNSFQTRKKWSSILAP